MGLDKQLSKPSSIIDDYQLVGKVLAVIDPQHAFITHSLSHQHAISTIFSNWFIAIRIIIFT